MPYFFVIGSLKKSGSDGGFSVKRANEIKIANKNTNENIIVDSDESNSSIKFVPTI